MKMTETELIARQAKIIEELKEELDDLKDRMHQAICVAVCVGGPLNDNSKGYTRPQMRDFKLRVDYLEGRI